MIAVTVYHAAFFCEAVRSGINSVGVGQAEAARSIGLTFTQSLRLVVLPQAFRTVIPPLINVVIALTKNTSIAAAFGVIELTAVSTRLANANSAAVIAVLAGVAVGYLVITLPSGWLAGRSSAGCARGETAAPDERGRPLRRRRAPGAAAHPGRQRRRRAAGRAAAGRGGGPAGRQGRFEADLWRVLTQSDLQRLLARGLVATLQAALLAMVLSMVVGALLAVAACPAELAGPPAGGWVELFRGLPLLLLILFVFLGLPALGVTVSTFWALVVGLTLYNSAVIGEIFRAGILSLPKGQTEAAYAIGLRAARRCA